MSDLGLQSGTVLLAEYNPTWPKLFQNEAAKLMQTLNITVDHIEHVGSTSIPGMKSKPILDIAILVDSLEIAEHWKDPLSTIGYWYKGIEPDLPDRRFFAKGPREKRTVYIHVVNKAEFTSLIKFRDRLRKSDQLAQKYSDLKTSLAAEHTKDRYEYTRLKNDFIREVLAS